MSRTPKAFTSYSPGLLQPWEQTIAVTLNAESVGERVAVCQRFQR